MNAVVSNAVAWLMVFSTVLLTAYGQLVLKWQVSTPAPPPFAWVEKWPPLLLLFLRPWVISAFVAAFAASLCWMLALSKLELNRAYPFMALNFLLVCLLAVPLFGETMTPAKLTGLGFIVVGLVILNQG
ncbi:MAG: EamA family transporter [Terriglobales bacterium]